MPSLVLLWNSLHESVDWVPKLSEVFNEHEANAPREKRKDWLYAFDNGGLFEPLQEKTFPNSQSLTPNLLITRVKSTSFIAALPETKLSQALDRVRELAATHRDLHG